MFFKLFKRKRKRTPRFDNAKTKATLGTWIHEAMVRMEDAIKRNDTARINEERQRLVLLRAAQKLGESPDW